MPEPNPNCPSVALHQYSIPVHHQGKWISWHPPTSVDVITSDRGCMWACQVTSVVSNSSRSCGLWTVAWLPPLSIGFSRPGCWSGLPCPLPGDLPDPEIEPESPVAPALQTDSLPLRQWGRLTVGNPAPKSISESAWSDQSLSQLS